MIQPEKTEQYTWWEYVLAKTLLRAAETGFRYRVKIAKSLGYWSAYHERIVPYQSIRGTRR